MTTAEIIQSARERHLAGDHPAARELYHRALALGPDNAAVNFGLGVLEMQGARFDQALGWIQRAAALAPAEPRYQLGLAQTLSSLRQYAQAAVAYRKVAASGEESADVYFSLGVALHMTNDLTGAIAAYRGALEFNLDFPGALTNLGAALQAAGQTDEAIAPLKAAVRLEPNVLLHRVNLGAILCQQQKYSEAEAILRTALAMDANFAEAAYNLGNVLKMRGHPQEAMEMYRRAITVKPGYADAHNNLGTVYKELGDFKSAGDSFSAAMRARPDLVAGYNNSGCLFRTLGRMDEAEAVLRKALNLGLTSPAVYNNLGNVLKDMGALDEAIVSYRTAMELKPDDAELHSNLVYSLSFVETDGNAILAECRRWNARHAEGFRAGFQPYTNQTDVNRRLRIGYVSADFRDHCQSLFTIPLLSHHDCGSFEIFCYSSVERPDNITERVKDYANVWRQVRLLNDRQLADLIRNDQIDILVDLGMHMSGSRPLVLARAPAPVQVAWLAYPGTTGIETIQYRLTDPRLDPPGFDDQYSEKPIRLPDSFWCYDPLAELEINELPARTRGFVTFGCLNNPCKLADRTLAMWGQVMRQVPDARLRLMAPPGESRRQLLARLEAHGIASRRVSFESFRPRSEYLRSYHEIDLGLDTFPYNGHTTSLDSFWMGVPVVTRVGETAVGRGGLSQLFNLNLTELAADSDDGFVRIAVELANDLPKLAELRRTLRQRMGRSSLMDGESFARNIEAACRQMWGEWCQNQKFHG